ncbi:hypothetical protein RhiJN_11225 [Ceratobasidium sp. AG-Ba]|nr:hypothetical protein RhiJN_11225 [Ceratobasidium sp. AG-Ba]
MSLNVHETESNNKDPPPELDTQNDQRDPEYYFPDGSAVFLVENVFFKLQASLLAPRGASTVEFRDDASSTRVLLDFSKSLTDQPGAADENPVRVPSITANQFRLLLAVLLGRPSDRAYISLLTDARYSNKHSQELLMRYLDLQYVSHKLMLKDIAGWALEQVEHTLASATRLADLEWEYSMLAAILVGYVMAGVDGLAPSYHLLGFFQLILSQSVASSPLTMRPDPNPNIDHCVAFFKSASNYAFGDFILGSTLPVLLSLGPNSIVWKDQLARDERAILYTVYAHWVSLQNNPHLELGWLENPLKFISFDDVCRRCFQRLFDAWNDSFGRIGTLDSSLPLEDRWITAHQSVVVDSSPASM